LNHHFYDKGLCFECQKECSGCCGGSPGYVFIDDEEIERISKVLNISVDHFLLNYTKKVGKRVSLIDLEHDNWNCVMLKEGRCTIYNDRPLQCRTYPFWPQNLGSRDIWEEEKEHCPGIDKGRRFSAEEIEDISCGIKTIDSVK
jgi:Fe-S-cluster containining protein